MVDREIKKRGRMRSIKPVERRYIWVKDLAILDTVFHISAENPENLKYIDYFMEAYDIQSVGMVCRNNINVTVKVEEIPTTIGGEKIKIHTTKHEYWNLSGEYKINRDIRSVLWGTRRILVKLDSGCNNIEIFYAKGLGSNFVGESVFHVLRSIALYKRENKNANFLHASAAVINDEGVLFTGAVSAGKTTLLLEMVHKLNATPLSNDRIYLKNTASELLGYSWPSYASFCEGTILDYAQLKREAIHYQKDEKYRYRTVNTDTELTNVFDKIHKRIYPMMWLCDSMNIQFLKSHRIQHVFFSHLDIACEQDMIKKLDYEEDSQFICQSLEKQLFDNREPSFNPWHGLEIKENSNSVKQLVKNMLDSGCKAYCVHINPARLDCLTQYIKNNI